MVSGQLGPLQDWVDSWSAQLHLRRFLRNSCPNLLWVASLSLKRESPMRGIDKQGDMRADAIELQPLGAAVSSLPGRPTATKSLGHRFVTHFLCAAASYNRIATWLARLFGNLNPEGRWLSSQPLPLIHQCSGHMFTLTPTKVRHEPPRFCCALA